MSRLALYDTLLPDEFRSIEDTLKKADLLEQGGHKVESEKYYILAHIKTELLKSDIEAGKKKTEPKSEPNDSQGVSEEPQAPPLNMNVNGEPGEKSKATVPDAAAGLMGGGKNRTGSESGVPEALIGSEITYVVKKRETLKMVSAKTGVNWRVIASDNHLDPKKKLEPGQVLIINNRKIVPKTISNGVVINIADRTLYFFRDGRLHVTFPVGLGMIRYKDVSSWQTPTGKFKIVSKEKNPAWHVPPSIQQIMKVEGKEVQSIVPPGPNNPLGKYALRTSFGGIMIHGTIFPESINSYYSHGCVRLLPRDMEALFKAIQVNTSGEIIYQPVKVAVSDNGRVFLEVHADTYKKLRNLKSTTKRLLEEKHAIDRVDWKKVETLLKNRTGIVEDITM